MKRLLLAGLVISLGMQSLNAMQQPQLGTRIPATAVVVTVGSFFHSLYCAYKSVRGTQQEKAVVQKILDVVTGMKEQINNVEARVNAIDTARFERAQRRAAIMQAHVAVPEAKPATDADVKEILERLDRIEAAQGRQVTSEDVACIVGQQLQQYKQHESNQVAEVASQPRQALIPAQGQQGSKKRGSCCRVALPSFCAGASVGAAAMATAGIVLREALDRVLIR